MFKHKRSESYGVNAAWITLRDKQCLVEGTWETTLIDLRFYYKWNKEGGKKDTSLATVPPCHYFWFPVQRKFSRFPCKDKRKKITVWPPDLSRNNHEWIFSSPAVGKNWLQTGKSSHPPTKGINWQNRFNSLETWSLGIVMLSISDMESPPGFAEREHPKTEAAFSSLSRHWIWALRGDVWLYVFLINAFICGMSSSWWKEMIRRMSCSHVFEAGFYCVNKLQSNRNKESFFSHKGMFSEPSLFIYYTHT